MAAVVDRIIGEHYIWRFAQKRCWRDFKLAVLGTVYRETHAYIINRSTMTWVNLAIFTWWPNCQIKITVNVSAYTISTYWSVMVWTTKMATFHTELAVLKYFTDQTIVPNWVSIFTLIACKGNQYNTVHTSLCFVCFIYSSDIYMYKCVIVVGKQKQRNQQWLVQRSTTLHL